MNDISNDSMVSRQNNTTSSYLDKTMPVQSVFDIMTRLRHGLPLTMTISQGKSEGCCVATVTIDYSDGTETQTYSGEWPIISIEALAGSFLNELSDVSLGQRK